MFKKKPQEYPIKTILDICQLDPSQLDDFFQDLRTWVLTTKGIQEAFNLMGFPEMPEGMIGMVWVDDGKHEYGGIRINADTTRDTEPLRTTDANSDAESDTNGQFGAQSEASGADGSGLETPDGSEDVNDS